MPTPPPDPREDHLLENWTHAGRVIRSVAHDINNHLGAILAYAQLIAAAPETRADARRMATEISIAARDSSVQLETLTALVSRDLSSVGTIYLNEVLVRVCALFRVELERGGSGIDLAMPETVCAFAGVRTRIVRALTHTLRHAADRVFVSQTPRRISLRLTCAGEGFRIEILGPALDPASCGEEFPQALAEAREHLRYHRGELMWVPPGCARLEVPRDTGLITGAPNA
jgi:C4-dicarboxylate-specific signal transduction histidine kinase